MDESVMNDWLQARILGNGSFGTVSLWTNLKTGENIAIKMCRKQLCSNVTQRQKKRWEMEVSIMKHITHNNIVAFKKCPSVLAQILDNYNSTGLPIMSMEYCEKGNLRSQLNKIQNLCGLVEPEVREILEDVLEALKYLHCKKITHRDVKPENIVVQKYDHRKSAAIYKIIDLGYAKEITGTASLVGTLQYLAPEIFYKIKYNHMVDYWSFGITCFEIICGKRPFDVPNMTSFESFQSLKRKKSNDIFMYKNENKEIRFSTEILEENFISRTFKKNLEVWLRSVLQFNPNERGSIYPNKDVFGGLQNILNKKIITIFSMHTYEFYSYEIEDSTKLSTVHDWIAKDIKIPKSEQFLILGNGKIVTGSNFAVDIFSKSLETMLYVFKKGIVNNKIFYHKLPKYVQIILEESFQMFKHDDPKKIYTQLLYYVSKEMMHMRAFKVGLQKLNNTLESKYSTTKLNLNFVQKQILRLLYCIEFHKDTEKSRKSKNTAYKKRFYDNLTDYEHLLHKSQECVRVFKGFTLSNLKITKDLQNLQNSFSVMDTRLNSDNMNLSYDEIVYNIRKLNEEQITVGPKMVKALSDIVKVRDQLLRMRCTADFIESAIRCLTKIEKITNALESFIETVKNISDEMEKNKVIRIKTPQEYENGTIRFTTCTNDNMQRKIEDILKENDYWRCRIEDLINSNLQHLLERRSSFTFD